MRKLAQLLTNGALFALALLVAAWRLHALSIIGWR